MSLSRSSSLWCALVIALALLLGAPSVLVTAAALPNASSPLSVLANLRIAPQNFSVIYNRDTWVHWIDADGDCQNTRAEVLITESLVGVNFTSSARCTVLSGLWRDPYTGLWWTLASDMDVDHLVALNNAHLSGAWAWNATMKRAYANDLVHPEHLIAVQDSINQQKSAYGPEEWQPPLLSYHCQYAIDWASVKVRWGLTATQAEYAALESMLLTCPPPNATDSSSSSSSSGGTGTGSSNDSSTGPPPKDDKDMDSGVTLAAPSSVLLLIAPALALIMRR